MQVKEKLGNLELFAINNRHIDFVQLEWYETGKRILHKKTGSGRDVTMRFLQEQHQLNEGDVVYEDDFCIIAIDIKPCETIVIRPRTMFEIASVCYEIGNKHIPLFFQDQELLVAHEAPLMKLLQEGNYDIAVQSKKLLRPLKTSVNPHCHQSDSLFSRILKKTTAAG